jgi:hypothetical protein
MKVWYFMKIDVSNPFRLAASLASKYTVNCCGHGSRNYIRHRT